jgi:hypothetical protein
MSQFVFLFRSTEAGAHAAVGTPERAQQSIQTWLAWIHDLEANGHLKERGLPLDRGGKVVRAAAVTDGPFVEAKDLVLGFIVVDARDIEHAAELAARCPIVLGGGSVEVRPVTAIAT